MKKAFYIIGLAALAITGCTLNEAYVNPDVPRVDKPLPVIKYEGSGNLVTGHIGEETKLNSTYSWEAKDNTITINIGFDLEEYIEIGNWELGYFFLDLDSINDYLGILVTSDTNEENFYGVEPDGSKVDYGDSHACWTSYMPGMWINADGTASGSGGMNYWQWYIWTGRDGIYYDYGDGTDKTYNGLFLVGGNPGNVAGNAAKLVGTTTTSKAKLVAGDVTHDFVVNIKYTNYDASDDGWDHSDPNTGLTGESVLKLNRDTESTFPFKWNISAEKMEFTCELSIAKLVSDFEMEYHEAGEVVGEGDEAETITETGYYYGPYAIGYVKMDLGMISEIIGKDLSEATFEEFYPCDAEGNLLTTRYVMNWDTGELEGSEFTGWTAFGNIPGEWVTADSKAGNWSSGAAYWWINFDQENYAEIMCENAFVIGNGPNTVHHVGDVVTSYNMLCDIPFNVIVKYVE
ncbi:MAG: hypothetical protein K6E37_04975 [Bacteroidales bacterium]|nr:hypothetical protein [Bacteroidales bacterium]